MHLPQAIVIALLAMQFVMYLLCAKLRIKLPVTWPMIFQPFTTAALLYWGGFFT